MFPKISFQKDEHNSSKYIGFENLELQDAKQILVTIKNWLDKISQRLNELT